MLKKGSGSPEQAEITAFLGKGTEFKGVLSFEGTIRVDGKVACDCELTFRVVNFPAPELKTYMQKEAERLQFPLGAIANG